jgi:hypothetical protein
VVGAIPAASIGLITRSARQLVVRDVAKLATIVAEHTGTIDATLQL